MNSEFVVINVLAITAFLKSICGMSSIVKSTKCF